MLHYPPVMAPKEYVSYPVRIEKDVYEIALSYCEKEEIKLASLLRKLLKAHLRNIGELSS